MLQKLLGLPLNASAQGAPIDELNGWVHLLMLVLFVGWGAFFTYILFRFRSGKNPKADHDGVQSHASSYLEAGIAVIEIVLLVALSIPFWSKKVSAFPSAADTLRVRIIAQQFAWNVQYPGPDEKFGKTDITKVADDNPIGLDRKDKSAKDDVVDLNLLRLPVNRPVILDIATKDVIHSFWLPLFRVKQDTIPGMRIPIYFTPTQTTDQIREQMTETINLPSKRNVDLYFVMKTYNGKDGNPIVKERSRLSKPIVAKLIDADITQVLVAPATPTEIACAQLCGLNHFSMKGYLTVLPETDFEKWYAEAVEDAKSE